MTTTPRAWSRNQELTQATRHVRAALGLHPQLVAERAAELSLWEAHLGETRYIGEVGLGRAALLQVIRSASTLAATVREQAQAVGIPFKAIVADCFYGDNHALEAVFRERQLPYVLAHRGTVGRGWAPADAAHSFDVKVPGRALYKLEARVEERVDDAVLNGRTM